MLILRRKRNQWIDVTHRSGDVMRILVRLDATDDDGQANSVNLGFVDAARNFSIQRPERKVRGPQFERLESR